MHQLQCNSDFPLDLLMEMSKDRPEILKSTQIVIQITGEQLLQWSENQQRAAEAHLERFYDRMRKDGMSLKYITTHELKESFHISPTRANELQHLGVFTDIIKIGRQNAYNRSEVMAYINSTRK